MGLGGAEREGGARTGDIRGARSDTLPVIYGVACHWRRGGLPFKGEEEMLELIEALFDVEPQDAAITVEASRLKVLADAKLRSFFRRPACP